MKNKLFVFFLLLFITLPLIAQNKQENKNILPLPHGYRDILLGMTLDATKTALLADKVFGYRGDRDVSLLPNDYKQTIIESSSNGFIKSSWFLFFEQRLYNMTININQELMDYNSVFKTLCNKYGQPESLNPQKAQWSNEWVIMTLEKPLSIKYVDKIVSESLQQKSEVKKSTTEFLKEDFLNSL